MIQSFGAIDYHFNYCRLVVAMLVPSIPFAVVGSLRLPMDYCSCPLNCSDKYRQALTSNLELKIDVQEEHPRLEWSP